MESLLPSKQYMKVMMVNNNLTCHWDLRKNNSSEMVPVLGYHGYPEPPTYSLQTFPYVVTCERKLLVNM